MIKNTILLRVNKTQFINFALIPTQILNIIE